MIEAMAATRLEVFPMTSVISSGVISPSPKLLAMLPMISAIEGRKSPAMMAESVPMNSMILSFRSLYSKNLLKATGFGSASSSSSFYSSISLALVELCVVLMASIEDRLFDCIPFII